MRTVRRRDVLLRITRGGVGEGVGDVMRSSCGRCYGENLLLRIEQKLLDRQPNATPL